MSICPKCLQTWMISIFWNTFCTYSHVWGVESHFCGLVHSGSEPFTSEGHGYATLTLVSHSPTVLQLSSLVCWWHHWDLSLLVPTSASGTPPDGGNSQYVYNLTNRTITWPTGLINLSEPSKNLCQLCSWGQWTGRAWHGIAVPRVSHAHGHLRGCHLYQSSQPFLVSKVGAGGRRGEGRKEGRREGKGV